MRWDAAADAATQVGVGAREADEERRVARIRTAALAAAARAAACAAALLALARPRAHNRHAAALLMCTRRLRHDLAGLRVLVGRTRRAERVRTLEQRQQPRVGRRGDNAPVHVARASGRRRSQYSELGLTSARVMMQSARLMLASQPSSSCGEALRAKAVS